MRKSLPIDLQYPICFLDSLAPNISFRRESFCPKQSQRPVRSVLVPIEMASNLSGEDHGGSAYTASTAPKTAQKTAPPKKHLSPLPQHPTWDVHPRALTYLAMAAPLRSVRFALPPIASVPKGLRSNSSSFVSRSRGLCDDRRLSTRGLQAELILESVHKDLARQFQTPPVASTQPGRPRRRPTLREAAERDVDRDRS